MFNCDLYLLDIRTLIMEEALMRSIFEEECTQCPMKGLAKGKTCSKNNIIITGNGVILDHNGVTVKQSHISGKFFL